MSCVLIIFVHIKTNRNPNHLSTSHTGTALPRVELVEIGPSFDIELRRTKFAADEMYVWLLSRSSSSHRFPWQHVMHLMSSVCPSFTCVLDVGGRRRPDSTRCRRPNPRRTLRRTRWARRELLDLPSAVFADLDSSFLIL
jgi:hypothetical protein